MRRVELSVLKIACVFLIVCATASGHTGELPAQSGRQFPQPIDLSASQPVSPSASGSLFSPGSLSILQDAASDLTVDQVAALPSNNFAPFDANKTYPLSAKTVLWLHFRAVGPAATTAANWTLALPKPFVDGVALFYRNAEGGWDQQLAGDRVPQLQWAVRGLYPQFLLPKLSAGTNEFYVKVNQLLPLQFDLTLKTAEAASFQHQNTLLADALLLGLMVFVSLFAFVLALLYKNKIYAWYAAYVLSAFLAVASYVGVGFYAFWPTFSTWAEMSHTVCLMLGVTAQIQFCSSLFVSPRVTPRLHMAVSICAAVLTAVALSNLFLPSSAVNWRVQTTLFVLSVSTVLMICIVIKAVIERRRIAWLWMAAYAPVLLALSLTLVEQFGLRPLPWLPYNAVGMAVGFEVLTLLIALHLHVKSNHELDVRQMTLVELDPLTGFLAPLYFPDVLAQLWSEARHQRQDIAVAYIRADVDLDGKRPAAQISGDELARRCVRMLRMVTRPDDTVARINGNMFAILMPGVAPGPNLAGKLSRLIALGLMHDAYDASGLLVKFRVAVTSFSSFSGTSSELDRALKKKLLSLNTASERGIVFVTNR